MAKVITKEDVQAAADKAADKATAAARKECVAAVKAVEVPEDAGKEFKAGIKAAVEAIKALSAE